MARKEDSGVCIPEGGLAMALLKAVASRVDTESARIMSRSLPSDKKVWRKEYGKHFVDHVKLMSASREVCLSMACEGLRQVYSTLRFARAGEEVSLDSAMMHPTRGRFRAARIRGRKAREPFRIPIPAYSVGARALRGGDARGADCVRAVRAWAAAGVVEPSCIRAIEQASVGQWDAEIASHVFVVMGAGAAMGPFEELLAMGATVIAIDLDRKDIQRRLVKAAINSAGTLILPVHAGKLPGRASIFDVDISDTAADEALYSAAGANLLEDTPEIADWLASVEPARTMTLGAYCYLDGSAFVRVAVAQDMIQSRVCELRGASRCSLAFLCTPTDIFARPLEARKASERNFHAKPLWQNALVAIGALQENIITQPPIKSAGGAEIDLIQCVIGPQGPNYLLAKRIQHWRAIRARCIDGVKVSSNVAPASSTQSVEKNWILAMAYAGVPFFDPIEVFAPATSRAVMAAALLHDIFDYSAIANPAAVKLAHPLHLFADQAWHGGFWRCGVEIPGAATVAAFLGMGWTGLAKVGLVSRL